MITFNKSDFDTILEYAKKNLPEEACGLIGGTTENGDKHIKKIYLLTNIDHSNEHFSMDPKEQLAVNSLYAFWNISKASGFIKHLCLSKKLWKL